MPRLHLFLSFTSFLLVASSTWAVPILVDFGISSQTTSDTGWNNMSATSAGNDPASLSNLISDSGAATTIVLAYATSGNDSGVAGTGANYNGSYPAAVSSFPQSALQDGLFFSGDTITLTLSNLDPTETYLLTLYGARGNNGTGASYTATGANVVSGTLTTAFNNAAQVVELDGITPNASGEVALLLATNGAGSSALNTLQLELSTTDPVDPPPPLGPPNPNLDPTQPNVIVLYYDDLGYSDVGVYDTTQPSYTPNLDALAGSGLRFTAGHSGDAVCTPSRYGILTGRYCWRTRLKTFVTGGYSRPLIDTQRLTMPKMFQELGYSTAMIGKWHLGMQFYAPDGSTVDIGNNANVLGTDLSTTSDDLIDFSTPLTETPNSYGFDYYFGTSASLDMPPYTWIENQTVLFKGGIVNNGTVDFSQATPATNSDFLEGEPIGAIDNVRDGAYDPNFVVADYLQVQAEKVKEVLVDRSRDGEPFFIYVPFPTPHLPWSTQGTFTGTSGAINGGTSWRYADFLVQSDHYAGVILDALADPDGDPTTNDGLDGNTVVYMSSDNGTSRAAMGQSIPRGHDGNGPFRGQKLDNWEGGTRVPWVIRWPGVTTAGAVTDFNCWQGDFFATMAEFFRYDFTPDEAPDAESFLPILSGQPMPAERRAATTQHAVDGQLAILDKDGIWKLLDGTGGNGSNSYDANNVNVPGSEATGVIFGTPRQLYNLSTDIGETTNLLVNPRDPTRLTTDPVMLAKEAELYALLNEIRGNTTFGTDGDSNVPPIDSDNDGLPNYFENETNGLDRDDPTDGLLDFDNDGLPNGAEFQNGASLFNPDTDGDQVSDALEVLTFFSLPNTDQSDGDGLPDGEEVYLWNTDPTLDDTDGDGQSDSLELANFSNPRSATSTLTTGPPLTVALDPSCLQLAGIDGNTNDPMVQGSWTDSGSIYIRERTASGSQQNTRTQLFLKFDLGAIEGIITEARLKVFQTNRLNNSNVATIGLGRVTSSWGTSPGNYPLYETTPVADTFTMGSNSDFGASIDASGFYGGAPGVIGDETGFDTDNRITNMTNGWLQGTFPNYGIRIAFDELDFVGAAFADSDDPNTPENETIQLLVTYTPIEDKDSDNDLLNDDYELATFGNLNQSGTDDFDGDGSNNLLEWALGSDPSESAQCPILQFGLMDPDAIEFGFHRVLDAGLSYEIRLSEDLETWGPYTDFYRYQNPAPASKLGPDFDKINLEPIGPLPNKLFYQIFIDGQN